MIFEQESVKEMLHANRSTIYETLAEKNGNQKI